MIDRMRLARLWRRRTSGARRARAHNLRDPGAQQDDPNKHPETGRRAAAVGGENETEKIPRHYASADDAQTNAFRRGALPFDLDRMWRRGRIVNWLWNLSGYSLRDRGEIR